MQGANIADIVRGKDAPGPESAFIMSISHGLEEEQDEADAEKERPREKKKEKKGRKNGGMVDWRGVRTRRYTFANREEDGVLEPWLLYDNEKDPCQMRNLIDDPAHAQTRKELEAMLGEWRKRVGEA